MNIQNELEKIRNGLKIPISSIEFFDKYVDLFSGGVKIGPLPFIDVKGIITYEIEERTVNWLKWQYVYDQNATAIRDLIEASFGLEKQPFLLTCGTFRTVYLNKGEEKDLRIVCYFEDDVWKLEKQN